MFFLKWLLVLAVLAAGVLILLSGLGIVIPIIKYQGLEAHGLPIGLGICVIGVALAAFWKISTTTTITEESGDSFGRFFRRIVKTQTKYFGPHRD